MCAKVAVRQDETVSELSLARVNDFGCAKQQSCLELTNTYDPCTNKYTMCLSWDACEFKNPSDTISHVCSFSFGNSACNRDVFWSGGSMCMNVFENWPSNNQVCVEVVPGAYAYYGVKDRSVCGNSNSPASYMLLNGGVSGDCVSSTSTVVGAYPYFYDCAGGNTGECLWRFLAPPAPNGVVCPPSPCSTVTSTVQPGVPCGKYMCDNYSQCMAKCASGPRCKCKYGYYGTGCKYYSNTLAQKCSELGCKNGNCVFNSQKVATCQCLPGHTGPKCL